MQNSVNALPNSNKTPKKAPSLKKNFVYNFVSQILTLIIPLITTPYLARVLHETGNGQISYASSIITMFLLFANLGFDTYGQREIAKVRDDKVKLSKTFWEIVFLRFGTTFLSSIVLVSMLFTIGFSKSNDLIAIFAIELFGNFLDINFLFRGEEDFRTIAIRTILLKIVGMICIFVFVKTENDTWVYCLCLSISLVLSNLAMWPSLRRMVNFVPIKTLGFKQHILPTIAIFVPALATTIFSVMDKAEIGWFAENSDYENGCYEQAYKINSIGVMLVTLISPVLAPRSANEFASSKSLEPIKKIFNLSAKYIFMMGLPLILGFAVLSNSLCSWYLGNGYAEVPLLLKIMSVRFIVSGFGEILGSVVFIPIGKEKYNTIASCVGAVLNVILNYFFIKLYGATGAAITTAISEIVVTFILLCFAKKEGIFSFKIVFSKSYPYFVSSIIMFLVIFSLNYCLPQSTSSFFLIFIIGSFIYFDILLALNEPFTKYGISWLTNILRKVFTKASHT